MKPDLQPGVQFTLRYRVPEEKTVPYVYPESEDFRTMPKVFATAFMVGFMEWACIEAIAPFLDEGEITLGVAIHVSHEAATPPGMEVRAQVRLLRVEGMKSVWEVEAWDEKDLIGKGQHERFTVNRERFLQKLEKKRSQ